MALTFSKGNPMTPWARMLPCLALALVMLAGCGSGGSGASEPSAPPDDKSVLVTASQVADIGVRVSASQDTLLTIPAGNAVGSTLTPGRTVVVPAGIDARFPLGFAGKVAAIANNADGSNTVTLAAATLADAVQGSKVSQPAVALGAENFMGVLAPSSVLPSSTSRVSYSSLRGDVSALGGALVVRRAQPNLLQRALSTVLPGGGSINAGSIELNGEVAAARLVEDPSRLKPYGGGAEAKVVLNIKLNNLMLTENHEFGGSVAGLPIALKSMDMHVDGDLTADLKFVGGAEASLGFFSQAWKEVEDQGISLLGASAKLTGLDSKDKVGKFPIAGLVFSVPCAETVSCPVQTGSTQTPLQLAKAGGVIVWLYLMADGTIKVDGALGIARAQDLHFFFGMQMPEGGKLDKAASFSHSSTAHVIDAPYLEGSVDVAVRTGVAIDVDFFALGIRVADASAAILSQATLAVTGSVAHSWPNFASPWEWTGSACFSSQIGAGLIVSAQANFGVEIETALGTVDRNLTYSGQWPSDAEIASPGWYGIPLGAHGSWFTDRSSTACWPAPVASSVSAGVSGTTVTIAAAGSRLPDDLLLVLTNPDACTGLQPVARTSELVTFACTLPAGGVPALTYQLASAKAGNLDTSALSGVIPLSPVISDQPQNATADVGQTATFSVSASGIAPLRYQWRRNGINVTCATGSDCPAYVTPPLTASDNGAVYSVEVRNAVGTVSSSLATLSVGGVSPPPSGDQIAVSATPDPVRPGDLVHYAVTVTNRSNGTNFYRVTSLTPTATTVLPTAISAGGTCGGNPSATCMPGTDVVWYNVAIAAGQSASFTYAAKVDLVNPPTPGALLHSVASATVLNGTPGSVAAPIDVLVAGSTDLALGMSTASSPVAPGGALTYTLRAGNPGTSASPESILTVPLPSGTSLVSASDGGSLSGRVVQWAVPALAAGAALQRTLSIQVDPAATNGLAVVATADLRDAGSGRSLARGTAAAAVIASSVTQMAISATSDPLRSGDLVQYSVTVTNRSSGTNFYVIDALTPSATTVLPTAISAGGTCGGNPSATCIPGTAVRWYNVAVAAGQSASFTFAAKVDSANPPAAGALLHSSAVATVLNGEYGGAAASTDVLVAGNTDLALGMSTASSPVAPGGMLSYTLRVGNPSDSASPASILTVPLPPGTSLASASDGGSLSGRVVQWAVPALAAGAALQRTLSVQIDPAANDGLAVVATADLRDAGSGRSLARGTAAAAVIVFSVTQMAISATPDPVRSGDVVQFTVTVTNRSSGTNFYVIDALTPSATTVLPTAISAVGTCGGNPSATCIPGTAVRWYNVAIAAGQRASLTFAAKIDSANPPAAGALLHSSAVATVLNGEYGGAAASVDVALSP